MRFPYILFPEVPTSRELYLLPSVASQPQTGGLPSVMNYHDPPRDSFSYEPWLSPGTQGEWEQFTVSGPAFAAAILQNGCWDIVPLGDMWLLGNVSELHNRCLRCILRYPKLGHSLSDLGQLVFSQRKEAGEKQDMDISHYTQLSSNLPYPFICTSVDPGNSEQ